MVDPEVLETISGIESDELNEWLESLEDVLHRYGPEKLGELLIHLQERAYQRGVKLPFTANTPYINTIHHIEFGRIFGGNIFPTFSIITTDMNQAIITSCPNDSRL